MCVCIFIDRIVHMKGTYIYIQRKTEITDNQ